MQMLGACVALGMHLRESEKYISCERAAQHKLVCSRSYARLAICLITVQDGVGLLTYMLHTRLKSEREREGEPKQA